MKYCRVKSSCMAAVAARTHDRERGLPMTRHGCAATCGRARLRYLGEHYFRSTVNESRKPLQVWQELQKFWGKVTGGV